MDYEIVFWELTSQQVELLKAYFIENGYEVPSFTEYNGMFYLEQSAEYEFMFQGFDFEDGIIGNDFGTHVWTQSTVPNVLWP